MWDIFKTGCCQLLVADHLYMTITVDWDLKPNKKQIGFGVDLVRIRVAFFSTLSSEPVGGF